MGVVVVAFGQSILFLFYGHIYVYGSENTDHSSAGFFVYFILKFSFALCIVSYSQVYSYSLWLIFDTVMFDAFLDYAVILVLMHIED